MKKQSHSRNTDEARQGPDAQQARDIWLAGLGALGKAQQQGGKAFDALVAEGLELQRKAQSAAQAHMAEAAARLSTMTGGLSEQTGQSLDRLGGIFEERVAKALARLDVASRTELQALQKQVEALQAQLAQMQAPPPPAPPMRRRGRSTG